MSISFANVVAEVRGLFIEHAVSLARSSSGCTKTYIQMDRYRKEHLLEVMRVDEYDVCALIRGPRLASMSAHCTGGDNILLVIRDGPVRIFLCINVYLDE